MLDLLPEKGRGHWVYHRVLNDIYRHKGETKKAIRHLEMALRIASSLNMAEQLFWVNISLAGAFRKQGRFEDAQTHVEHAKSHAVNSPYLSAYTMDQQARVWDG